MKRMLRVTIWTVCLSVLLLGLVSPATADESFLRVAVSQGWPTLDPGGWTTTTTGLNQIYENLFRFKPGTTEVQPWLAESYEISADKKTYTLRLKKGITFHDGSAFNAESVVFSIDRAKRYKGTGYSWLKLIKDAVAVDDQTVELTLESPSPIFVTALAHPSVLRIVSPTAVKTHEKEGDLAKAWLEENDAGTGPYTLKKTAKMDHIYLERFSDYWGGWEGKHLDKVLFKYVREASSRKMMLLNKEVDIAEDLLFDDVDELKASPDLNVTLPSTNTVTLLLLRHTGGKENPLTDKRVREAIAYAADYDNLLDVAMKGAAEWLQGPLASGLYEHNNTLKVYKRDVEKAKQLLKEAGYEEGEIELIIMYNVGYEWKRLVCETLMNNLKEIGIALDIHATTWPRMVASIQNGAASPPPHMYIYYASSIVDGFTVMNRLFHSQSIGSPEKGVRGWNPGYSNPELDRALDAAQVAPDMEQYRELMWTAQEEAHNDLAAIPLWQLVFVSTMSKKVTGYVPSPIWEWEYNLYDMYLGE
jgi:peptide/nickel transport system substrate-binding protein